jgi:hypothetical protein
LIGIGRGWCRVGLDSLNMGGDVVWGLQAPSPKKTKKPARHPCGFPLLAMHTAKLRVARLTQKCSDGELMLTADQHTECYQGHVFLSQ